MLKDGKSLFFRNYGDTEVDRDLLSGFLSAFSGFIKEISQSEIKSTATDEFKYFYTIMRQHFPLERLHEKPIPDSGIFTVRQKDG